MTGTFGSMIMDLRGAVSSQCVAPSPGSSLLMMQLVGINVITRTEVEECFAVIDDEIVWHGGMNLLGKADVWDNLMRIRNSQVATELLEIALGCSEERRKSE